MSAKKIIGVLIGVAAAALIVFAVLPGKKSVVAPGSGLENYVPSNTVAFYSLRDMEGTWKAIRDSSFYRQITSLPVWEQIQAQDAVSNFMGAFQEGFGFELTEGRVMDVIGDELAIAVVMGTPADPEPKILLLTRTGTKTQLAELVGRLLDKAKKEGQQKVDTWTYAGQKIHHVKSADPTVPELNYAFLDDVLVAGVGKTRGVMESVVDLYGGKGGESIQGTDNYKKFLSLVSDVKGTQIGMFYMDFDQISSAVAQANLPIPGAVGANVGQTLSLLKMIGGVSTKNDGVFTKIYVVPNKDQMDASTRSLWEVKPRKLSSLAYVPKGTVLYSVTNSMDVGNLWNIWKGNLSQQAPEQAATIMDAITQAEENLGISIEGDLLSWIGDEIAYTFNDVNLEGVFPVPKMSLIIKVTNKAKAEDFVQRLVDFANRQQAIPEEGEAAPPEAPPVRLNFEESNYNGVAMKFIRVPLMGKGLTPGFAFLGDFLVLSTSTTVMEQMADIAAGNGDALMDDPSFVAVKGGFPAKTNQMGYINTSRILDIGVDVCNWVVSFQQLNLAPVGAPGGLAGGTADAAQRALKDTVIPLLKAMKAVRVVGINTTYTEEGIEQIISTRFEDVRPIK